MTRIILLTVIVLGLTGCAGEDREGAERALTALSLTDIQIEPATHPWTAFTSRCSKDDRIQHAFTAKNATGASVSGVVCCGGGSPFLGNKGCTVRF